MLYYVYAEEHHCHPQDVPEVVTVEAWQRWLIWRKTKNSREANDAFGQPGAAGHMTPDQMRLMSWSVMEGEY